MSPRLCQILPLVPYYALMMTQQTSRAQESSEIQCATLSELITRIDPVQTACCANPSSCSGQMNMPGAGDTCEHGGECARVFMLFVEDCYETAMAGGLNVDDMQSYYNGCLDGECGTGCTVQNLGCRSAAITEACCGAGSSPCEDGAARLPTTCSIDCAAITAPFVTECKVPLKNLDQDMAEAIFTFNRDQCQKISACADNALPLRLNLTFDLASLINRCGAGVEQFLEHIETLRTERGCVLNLTESASNPNMVSENGPGHHRHLQGSMDIFEQSISDRSCQWDTVDDRMLGISHACCNNHGELCPQDQEGVSRTNQGLPTECNIDCALKVHSFVTYCATVIQRFNIHDKLVQLEHLCMDQMVVDRLAAAAASISCNPCLGMDCGAHGSCDGGTCNCEGMFSGELCEECSCVHGICAEGSCTCDHGWTGEQCDVVQRTILLLHMHGTTFGRAPTKCVSLVLFCFCAACREAPRVYRSNSYDCPGNDAPGYQSHVYPDLAACYDICQRSPSCNFFTYWPTNTPMGGGCWPKTQCPNSGGGSSGNQGTIYYRDCE
jgi:hypothetical protein